MYLFISQQTVFSIVSLLILSILHRKWYEKSKSEFLFWLSTRILIRIIAPSRRFSAAMADVKRVEWWWEMKLRPNRTPMRVLKSRGSNLASPRYRSGWHSSTSQRVFRAFKLTWDSLLRVNDIFFVQRCQFIWLFLLFNFIVWIFKFNSNVNELSTNCHRRVGPFI